MLLRSRIRIIRPSTRPPSFTREEPNKFIQPAASFGFDRARWTALVRSLSARFNAHPEIFDSDVRVTVDKTVRYFVSTEGARIVTEQAVYGFPFTEGRFDTGNKLDYLKATVELGLRREDRGPAFGEWLVRHLKARGLLD